MLPGVARVRKALAGGEIVEFWYAWRGGPQILRAQAPTEAKLAKLVAAKAADAAVAYRDLRSPQQDRVFFYGLVTRYLQSPTFARLGPRSQSDRRKHLDFARGQDGKLGQMEVKAFDAKGARPLLLRWRNRFAKTPKTADERLIAVSAVLKWAVDEGELRQNPVASFERLYRVNRAEIIWEPEDLAALLPHCPADLASAVKLAALTGLRESDLIRLTWSAVKNDVIVFQTGKSRGRRTVVIPILPELREALAEVRRVKRSVTILNSSKDRPWKLAGLASAWRLSKIEADKDRPGVRALRFHDLRGTAATNHVKGGADIEDVATMLAWEPEKVREIIRRYVADEVLGRALVGRIERNRAATEIANQAANRASGEAE